MCAAARELPGELECCIVAVEGDDVDGEPATLLAGDDEGVGSGRAGLEDRRELAPSQTASQRSGVNPSVRRIRGSTTVTSHA